MRLLSRQHKMVVPSLQNKVEPVDLTGVEDDIYVEEDYGTCSECGKEYGPGWSKCTCKIKKRGERCQA